MGSALWASYMIPVFDMLILIYKMYMLLRYAFYIFRL